MVFLNPRDVATVLGDDVVFLASGCGATATNGTEYLNSCRALGACERRLAEQKGATDTYGHTRSAGPKQTNDEHNS